MEEERRLPKNIRQIGEKEEGVRVYLEDYVYTFIHRLETEKNCRAGILLGSRENIEEKNCFFINGAVELEGLIREDGVCFSEETWKTVEEEISRYFSECSICGWFIRGNEDSFPNREMLLKVHAHVFANEDCLMYWLEENECIWVEDGKRLRKLGGYYVYYERNFQMQNYMLNAGERPASEMVSDRAAQNFRKIMKTKKRRKRTAQYVWTQAGTVAAAAIIFVGSVYLISRAVVSRSGQEEGTKDQVQAFAVGASVERVSGEEESEKTTETEKATLRFYRDTSASQAGRLPGIRTLEEVSDEAGTTESVETSSETGLVNGQSSSESEENASRNTQAGNTLAQESGQNVQESGSELQGENSAEGQGSEAAPAGAEAVPRKYTVRPGDTLADISIRFYGSTGMIMDICERNQIDNPNTIFIGQEIELP